jgi:uncharacterized delta-60 repeat protein
MRRTLALVAVSSLLLVAPAAQARPGDLDRSFSGDGRLALGTTGFATGLDLAGGLRPVLTVNPDEVTGRATWITLTATGRVAGRIAFSEPLYDVRAVWSGTALTPLGAGVVRLTRPGNAAPVTLTLPDPTISPNTFAIDGAGRVLVGGTFYPELSHGVVMRFLPTGVLDTTFAVTQPPSLGPIAFILPNADGGAYVSDGERIGLLDATGQPQAGFEQGRRFTPRRDDDSRARSLARGPDGTLLVAGNGNPTGPWIARLRADGRLDQRFGRTGHVSGGTLLRRVFLTAVTQDRRGRLLVAGERRGLYERSTAAVLRFSASGRLDRSFGTGGRALFQMGIVPGVDIEQSTPAAMAMDRRDRIVVAGAVYDGELPPTPYPAVARLRG